MLGKRVNYLGTDTLEYYQLGNYWKDEHGHWYGITPNGLLCNLMLHHVEEHDDGTISVLAGSWGSNSILVSHDKGRWHGYINHGVWEECLDESF